MKDQHALAGSGTLRVHRGAASAEELAALATVLRMRTAAVLHAGPGTAGPAPRPVAAWRRPERQPAYADPRAWHGPLRG